MKFLTRIFIIVGACAFGLLQHADISARWHGHRHGYHRGGWYGGHRGWGWGGGLGYGWGYGYDPITTGLVLSSAYSNNDRNYISRDEEKAIRENERLRIENEKLRKIRSKQ